MSDEENSPDTVDILQDLVEELVDRPECVSIESNETGKTAVIDIYVDPKDVGIVLGRGGAHAEALRTIFKAIYSKQGKRLYLSVSELK